MPHAISIEIVRGVGSCGIITKLSPKRNSVPSGGTIIQGFSSVLRPRLGLIVMGLFHIRQRDGSLRFTSAGWFPRRRYCWPPGYVPVATHAWSPPPLLGRKPDGDIPRICSRGRAGSRKRSCLRGDLAMTVLLGSRDGTDGTGTHNLLAMPHPPSQSFASPGGHRCMVADVLLLIGLITQPAGVSAVAFLPLRGDDRGPTVDASSSCRAFWEMPNYLQSSGLRRHMVVMGGSS